MKINRQVMLFVSVTMVLLYANSRSAVKAESQAGPILPSNGQPANSGSNTNNVAKPKPCSTPRPTVTTPLTPFVIPYSGSNVNSPPATVCGQLRGE